MKLKNTPLAVLTCASLLGSAALSQATIIISDNFDSYSGNLNWQGNGTGFSGVWYPSSSVSVTSGVATGDDRIFREFTGNTFGSTGTLWVSFDWGFAAVPNSGGDYGGLTFFAGGSGGSERFLIGDTWDSNVWGMNGATATSVSSTGMKTGVAKITLGAGATSTVELWVAATGSPVDVSGAAMATASGRTLEGVDTIRILGSTFGQTNQSIDNLVIGTTMADVSAIPEPASWIALGCLVGAGICLRSRRRACAADWQF